MIETNDSTGLQIVESDPRDNLVMSSLADRIRETREERGWTKAELKRRAGLRSPSTLTSLEQGEMTDSPQLAEIADALDVEIMWLKLGKGPKQRGAAKPETELSESALYLARLIDSLPKELSAKVTQYADTVKMMHTLDVSAGTATDARPLSAPEPLKGD